MFFIFIKYLGIKTCTHVYKSWMKHKIERADTSLCEVQSILYEYHNDTRQTGFIDYIYSTLQKVPNMLFNCCIN